MMIQRSVVGFVCFTTIRGDRTDDIINGWNKRTNYARIPRVENVGERFVHEVT